MKLRVFESISVDGYFTDAQGDIDWAHAGREDPEFADWVSANASTGGALLFGRKTYQMTRAERPARPASTRRAVGRPTCSSTIAACSTGDRSATTSHCSVPRCHMGSRTAGPRDAPLPIRAETASSAWLTAAPAEAAPRAVSMAARAVLLHRDPAFRVSRARRAGSVSRRLLAPFTRASTSLCNPEYETDMALFEKAGIKPLQPNASR